MKYTQVLKLPLALIMTIATSVAFGQQAAMVDDTDGAFHVFLLLGQSNMAGFSQAIESDKVPDPRIVALGFDDCPEAGRKEGEWSVAIPPLHECFNGALGPGDVFAKVMIETYPDGDRIGLVPLALSGRPVEVFMKGPDTQYEWIIERAKAAQQAGGIIEGMIYHQGESNCGQEDWPEKVATFVTDLRTELGLQGVPFITGELLYSGDCARHNPLVHQIPEVLDDAYVVSAEGLPMAEGDPWSVHFSREAEVELGQRFAEKMLEVLD